MPDSVAIPIVIAYLLASGGLMVYGGHCYLMLALFLRGQRRARREIAAEIVAFNTDRADADYPFVTLQLPVYNEAEVVARLLYSARDLDYPRDRFELQVLDDSTDVTRRIVDRVAGELRSDGIAVTVLRRDNRSEFKAGALKAGMATARGEYLAIFDADFLIPADFLKGTVSLIHGHDDVACVQARWGHTNRTENWLTRAQSVGIDGHFTAEQGARSYSGLFLNFNGTAGLWRASAIDAGGGWQGDTLTEDLDLSYRVQLAGYRIRYNLDLVCPAELPNTVVALKSQQRRWAKGSIETTRKLMPRIWRDKKMPFLHKIEAFLHLTHYAVALLMAFLCVLTLPMLIVAPKLHVGPVLIIAWVFIIISALAPGTMYTGSGAVLGRGRFSLLHYPAMLAVGTGLCLNNAIAVLEAVFGHKTEFVRTPKSGSAGASRRTGRYRADGSTILGFVEVLLGAYCVVTLIVYFQMQKYLFGFFISAYAIGLLSFGLLTLRTRLFPPPLSAEPDAEPAELEALRDL